MVVQDANFIRGWLFGKSDIPEPIIAAINSVCDFVREYSEQQLLELEMKNCPPMVIDGALRAAIDRAEVVANDTKDEDVAPEYRAHVVTGTKGAPGFKCSVCGEGSCIMMKTYATVEVEKNDDSVQSLQIVIPTKQKTTGWTPERRAEQGEKIRAARAARKAREAAKSSETFAIKDTAKGNVTDLKVTPLAKSIDAHELKTHAKYSPAYIGKRLDGSLTEADFGDIRERLAVGGLENGMRAIAGDYDVSVEQLSRWYDEISASVMV